MEGGLGDWMMKTSSSRTDEWMWTDVSSEENFETEHGVRGIPNLLDQQGLQVHFGFREA
jgi:hypothetical protein